MSYRPFGMCAAFALAIFGAVAFNIPAQAATNVLFILDGSGSMWAQVDGQPKIVTAKKILNDALRDLPTDTRVGLMSYGHRRKGDCGDIELISPIGSQNASAIAKKVNALQPKGETPIAAALARAAAAFKGIEGPKMIVLVTDGAEECKGDPCAATEQLAAANVDLHVNVVGFNLAKKEHDAVQCIAQKGRGTYYDAKDAKALSVAMSQVEADVKATRPCCSQGPENLLKNGSFEDGKEPGPFATLSRGSDAITGWAVTRDTIDYIGTYFPCSEGKRCIDMDGTPGFGGLSQSFATTPGASYVVRFDLGANPDGAPGVKKLGVTAAGQSSKFEHPSNHDWTAIEWRFTANGAQTTLEFFSMDTEGGNWGPMLDNVRVVRQP